MNGTRKSGGLGGLVLLPLVCCVGVPLAASIGLAALVWGGAVIGGLAVAGGLAVWFVRRRACAGACDVSPLGGTAADGRAAHQREEVVTR